MVEERRKSVPKPPRGRDKFKWYGPGLLWMVASVGSGSVLFTPRIGARYGYDLLWIALIVFFLMFVMIREIGR
jgi:Mn2+/Fe2+ NRAMP family transporter